MIAQAIKATPSPSLRDREYVDRSEKYLDGLEILVKDF
jgi:hypothetical protein